MCPTKSVHITKLLAAHCNFALLRLSLNSFQLLDLFIIFFQFKFFSSLDVWRIVSGSKLSLCKKELFESTLNKFCLLLYSTLSLFLSHTRCVLKYVHTLLLNEVTALEFFIVHQLSFVALFTFSLSLTRYVYIKTLHIHVT